MTKVVLRSLAVLAVLLLTLLSAQRVSAEDFYEQQLRIGKADLASGRNVQAVDELRIAAFGFLDRPPILIEALVNLALAQEAIGQPAAVARTVDRFLDVERRFNAYRSASIDANSRTAFETIVLRSAPKSDLTQIGSMSRLTRSDAEKVSDLPPSQRDAAFEDGFRKSRRDIDWPLAAARDAAARGANDQVIRWSKRALSIDEDNESARVLLAHAQASAGDCREALSQIARLSEAQLVEQPDIAADRFVCLTRENRWSDAESALVSLTPSIQQRADVARAIDTVKARRPQPPKPKPAAVAEAPRVATIAPTLPAVTQPTTTRAGEAPATTLSTPTPAQTSAAPPAIKPLPSPTPRTNTTKSADVLASGKTLIRNGWYKDATKLFEGAVAADPDNRLLRLSLLESAALARDWKVAAQQLAPLSPLKTGEEVSMFYAAAALFETGNKDDARALMQKARPRLYSTPFVDYYSRLILGENIRGN
jgi:tetratricopeptide (TPR) repeat protein